MRKKNKTNSFQLFNKILDVPEEISSQETKLTVIGFKKLLVENYNAILDYQDFYIRIKTKIGIININGFNMKLDEMNSDDVIITGDIDAMDFEKRDE